MDQRQSDSKITELRTQYPKMFSHPQAREGEVCLGPCAATLQVAMLVHSGLTSVREQDCGEIVVVKILTGLVRTDRVGVHAPTLFVDAREFVQYQYEQKAKESQKWYMKIWHQFFS